ncbi:MAG: hypothetical protein AB1689_15065 [Thermodesulfobacteriota bacterium]
MHEVEGEDDRREHSDRGEARPRAAVAAQRGDRFRDAERRREEEARPVEQPGERNAEGEQPEPAPLAERTPARVPVELQQHARQAQHLVVVHAAEVRAHRDRREQHAAEQDEARREVHAQESDVEQQARELEGDRQRTRHPGRVRAGRGERRGEHE